MGSRSAITAVLCGMLLLLLSCSSTQELSLLSQQSYNLGNAYLRLGEYEQAEAAYRFAVEERLSTTELHIILRMPTALRENTLRP